MPGIRSLIAPITSSVSRRIHFKGKARALDAIGLGASWESLVPHNAQVVQCIEGIRMDLSQRRDIMARELYLHGFYQDDVLVSLRNLLHPGDVFWDIGANPSTIVSAPSTSSLMTDGADSWPAAASRVEGGKNYLSRHHPPIVAEFNHESIHAAGLSNEAYMDAFRALGYSPHYMERPWLGWHRWETLAPVRDVGSLPALCNVVMLAKE